ncbi:MAG: RNA 2'-phosphotransferase [Euryarchaeota archaeon]|nr:RNA 2'-phosphotransferase [Euryarchaeota archaeon]MDE1837992.1 RNA 2'-phosphotransferase [Euryarchaeota archaeon]MDE1880654.1 RNA 2'-phosphotransferase [Euryarchaeota archaeon]MDE2046447.1 RNA 2'-phosphotransferase [Thermoplasmata archaeon]
MDERELDHIARILAGILRHFPQRYGIPLDPHGWVPIPRLVQAIRSQHRSYGWLKPHHIVALAETDPKGRYEIREERIRATYGHTVDVDLDLPTDHIPEALYYPVTQEEASVVLEIGLRPTDRKKVHLSKTAVDAYHAGRVRTPTPVILEVDTQKAQNDGLVIRRAGKTVFLVDQVPSNVLRRYDGELPSLPEEETRVAPAPHHGSRSGD